MNNPQHSGLGQPTAAPQQGNQNPYVTYNPAVQERTMRLNNQTAEREANIRLEGAKQGAAEAETRILKGLNAMGQQQQMAKQVEELAADIVQGQVDPNAVMSAASKGNPVAAQALKVADNMQQVSQEAAGNPYTNEPMVGLPQVPGY